MRSLLFQRVSALLLIVFLPVFVFMAGLAPVQAEDPFSEVCQGSASGSAACRDNTTTNPLLGGDGVITRVIQLVIVAVGAVSVFVIIVGGFKYIISAGDPQKAANAKNTILYAVIGLVIAVFAQAIVAFVLNRL